MKSLLSLTLASGMIVAATSAFACPMQKSASLTDDMTTASTSMHSGETAVEQEAMSTFDPKNLQGEQPLEDSEIEE